MGGGSNFSRSGRREIAAKRLVTISREQWRERWMETGPEHWTSRSESLIVAAARRMTLVNWVEYPNFGGTEK